MSFRRFVHLVVNDMNIRRCTYSLRSIDVSCLFRRPLESTGACQPPVDENQKMEPCPLPAPAMSFCPPRQSRYNDGKMEFMLLGGKHNKVVATDQTGRAILYDPDRHAVHTLRGFVEPKTSTVVALTGGDDDLYVLSALPSLDACFECLERGRRDEDDEDWYPRVLPPPPPFRCCDDGEEEIDGTWWSTGSPCIVSSAVSGDGARIWVTDQCSGTYAFDTATERWSKAGDWALPFAGAAAFVPEHGLWFGLRDDERCALCAVDLARASPRRPPAVRHVWEDLAPPDDWPAPPTSRLVHLGAAKFCVARFFSDNPSSCRHYPVTRAVFTGVEVERCADADGGLRMVKHRSKLYTLLHDMAYWVL